MKYVIGEIKVSGLEELHKEKIKNMCNKRLLSDYAYIASQLLNFGNSAEKDRYLIDELNLLESEILSRMGK